MNEISKTAITGSMLQRLASISPVNAINDLLLQPNRSVNLPIGTIMSGIVMSQDSNNNILLNTSKGVIIVNMALPVKVDNEIFFRVIANNPNVVAQLVDSEGKKIERDGRRNNQNVGSESRANKVADKTDIISNKVWSGSLTSIHKPAMQSFAPVMKQEIIEKLSNLNELKVRFVIGEVREEGAPKIIQASRSAENLPLVGRIVIRDNMPVTLFETEIGVIQINDKIKLPPNGQIILQILDFEMPVISDELIIDEFEHLPAGRIWESLQKILNLGAKHNVHSNLTDLIPRTNQQFTLKLIEYLLAVKAEKPEKYLGEELVKVLHEVGEQELLNKFILEFRDVKAQLAKHDTSDWINLIFPLYDGKFVRQEQLKLKHNYLLKDNQISEHDTRFLIDYDSTSLGAIQLDGLIKQYVSPKSPSRFQLIVRSIQDIPDQHTREIRNIITNISELTGMAASVQFIATTEFAVVNIENSALPDMYL